MRSEDQVEAFISWYTDHMIRHLDRLNPGEHP